MDIKELSSKIREIGVVGAGGAGFPAVGGRQLCPRRPVRRGSPCLRHCGGDGPLLPGHAAVQRTATLVGEALVGDLAEAVVIRPLAALARFCWKVIDTLVIDGALHVGAFVTELTGDLGRFSTTGNVRNYALYFFAGLLFLFWWMVL